MIYFTTLKKMLNWSVSSSLNYMTSGGGCCASELFQSFSSRYDLERFGALPEVDPKKCDLLIINGVVTVKYAEHLLRLYEQMAAPKFVMAVGSCACSGGPFLKSSTHTVLAGADKVFPIDVYVPGCPPRPEAIMNGLITLQEKIRGTTILQA